MVRFRTAVLLAAVFLLLPLISHAATGILEVNSDPAGAAISIDGVDSGTTPYQNLEMPAGKHMIRAVLSPEYPAQDQEVLIDERSPQVVMFKFVRSRGTFAGKEIVRSASKYKGNVTFASIPTGALVVINGEPLNKSAPIGYTSVEVGKYAVEFRLDGRTLRAEFDVIQGETVKLIADFAAGTVINKWQMAKLQQEAAKREEAKRQEQSQQTRQPQPQQTAVQTPEPVVSTKPQPAEGVPPFGELVITMNVVRDANLKYSDFFDIAFPKLPIDSLSGPVFPAASAIGGFAFRDNFEYTSDALANTRRFSARVDFGSRDAERAEGRARSSIMTVREGTYDLKLIRRRIADRFYSVEKLLDATAQETIEIVRGSRLIVQIDSHIGADNKLNYEIRRNYENLVKKKSSTGEAGAQQTSKAAAKEFDSRSLPIFGGEQ